MPIRVHVEFSGGLELLFANKKELDIEFPALGARMSDLISALIERHLKERVELFAAAGTHTSVRPGILVLINDTDWELEGTTEYELADGDRIAFISTLHGG